MKAKKPALVSIGRFSRMTRLSAKALRLYDERALLRPAQVDPSSGYRFYEPAQAKQAEVIRMLRSVDMPLDEIKSVLEAESPTTAVEQLEQHRARLADRMAVQERMLAYLESIIQSKERIMPYEINIETVSPQQIAAVMVRTSLSRIKTDIGGGFGKLMAGLGRAGAQPAGMPFIVYHDMIDEETQGRLEIGVPVAMKLGEDPDVKGRELEGGDMATTTHHGPYEEIGAAYHTLTGWISEKGFEIVGPPREIYLNDPQTVSPEQLLTRVEFPIRKE